MIMFIIYKHCSRNVYYLNYFATYAGFVFISTWVYQFLKFDVVKSLLGIADVEHIPFHGDIWGYTVLSDHELLFRVVALSSMLVLSVVGYRTVTTKETSIPNALDASDQKSIRKMDEDALYNATLKQKEVIFWNTMSVIWPVINFVATFFHIFVILVVVYQSLFWKLSWTMIIYLFFCIGPWYGLDLEFLQTVNLGNDKQLTYYCDIAVRTQRFKKWKTLMLITTAAWTIIFPSQKILELLDKSVRAKAIFYGEWAGVLFPATTPGTTFWNYVSGYMAILAVLVLEKKVLEWLADEDIRDTKRIFQETYGGLENSQKNYETLSKEIARRQELKSGRRSTTKVGFAGINEEDKIDVKEKLKKELEDAYAKLPGSKKKEETKKPHAPLKSAMKKSSLKKQDIDFEDEGGPKGPRPFEEKEKSAVDENEEGTDEAFNLIFTRDNPKRNETKKKLLFQYKIKFMRGFKTFAEE